MNFIKRGSQVRIIGLYFDGFIGEVEIVGAAHVTVKLFDKGKEHSIKFWRSQVELIT